MKALIDNTIEILAKEIKSGMPPDAALKITQAILNMAHTNATLDMIKEKD